MTKRFSDRTKDEDEDKETKDTIVRKGETQINGVALMREQREIQLPIRCHHGRSVDGQ